MKLLVHSARQVVLVTSKRAPYIITDDLEILENGVSIAIDDAGHIAAIGSDEEIKKKFQKESFKTVIDASEKCILPGFIDSHTHPVWSGDRVHEFAMKLAGASYMDIHKSGGGIYYTVEESTKSSEEDLYSALVKRLTAMMQAGTTLVECKSGYGLEVEAELKLLRVLERARRNLPIEISITFCGAHAIPKGKTAEEATENIIKRQIPKVKQLIDAGELLVENIDVFCEKGVFSTDQTKRILQAGKNIHLKLNFHSDELHFVGGAEMGAELGAKAISHLEEISEEGIKAMSKSKSVAVILPTTAYLMRLKSPPVQKLIAAGVPVALGTDFNPNAYCFAMPLVMNLACVTLGMSLPQALIASTLNAAASLGRSATHGSIEIGKVGDLIIIEAPRWEHIIYQLGAHTQLITAVIKKGDLVYAK